MNYTLYELKPREPVLYVDGEAVNISFFTLEKDVIFKSEFGSLSKCLEKIKEKPTTIINVIFLLLKEPQRFNYSSVQFYNYVLGAKESLAVISSRMQECLTQSINDSMPLIKNEKRYKELSQINQTQSEEKPCYGVYFDKIAKRYPYTLEGFYTLTLRQLHILLNVIGDQSYEELEVQAALQGKKLKPRMKFIDVSENEDKENEDQAMDALKRLQKEYKERNGK